MQKNKDPVLTFNSSFLNNAVYIIDGLSSGELQTAIHLKEGLQDLKNNVPLSLYCNYLKVKTQAELLHALNSIEQQCVQGVKPIIHFEAHGDKEDGMLIGDNREMIAWSELVNKLRIINVITGNNTGVVMASCFGLYAIRPITIHSPAPFYFLLGSDGQVTAGEIDAQMTEFYKCLFNTNSLSMAMDQIDSKFQQFHAEKFICTAIGQYFKRQCTGKGARKRLERLVSQAISRGAIPPNGSLSEFRKRAKQFIKPSKKIFERYAKIFLHDRCSIDYDQLISFIREKRTMSFK